MILFIYRFHESSDKKYIVDFNTVYGMSMSIYGVRMYIYGVRMYIYGVSI